MHAGLGGAADDPASVKMSRSRSVDYAENRYLDDTHVGHVVDKRRSITPITYTRLERLAERSTGSLRTRWRHNN